MATQENERALTTQSTAISPTALNIPASEKLSFVLERRSRNQSLPKRPKVDENTHRKHQQPFSVLTDCKCLYREESDDKSTRMECVYLFWARSFPNYQNLATVPSLLPIWAFYTLTADEQIGQNRLRELSWIPNFWETDKLILVRTSVKELNSHWSRIFWILLNKSSITDFTKQLKPIKMQDSALIEKNPPQIKMHAALSNL